MTDFKSLHSDTTCFNQINFFIFSARCIIVTNHRCYLPGGLIASAWAGLVHLGEDGYLKGAQEMHRLFNELKDG